MPLSKDPQQRGHLLIRFHVAFPSYLSEKQKLLLKQAFSTR